MTMTDQKRGQPPPTATEERQAGAEVERNVCMELLPQPEGPRFAQFELSTRMLLQLERVAELLRLHGDHQFHGEDADAGALQGFAEVAMHIEARWRGAAGDAAAAPAGSGDARMRRSYCVLLPTAASAHSPPVIQVCVRGCVEGAAERWVASTSVDLLELIGLHQTLPPDQTLFIDTRGFVREQVASSPLARLVEAQDQRDQIGGA